MESYYSSMMDTIISSLQKNTKNIYDYIKLGQMLWPKYVKLVHDCDSNSSDKYKSTLMRWIKQYFQQPGFMILVENKTTNFALLHKYILIAAFLCQRNKAKFDSKYFQSANTTKKRKRKQKEKRKSTELNNDVITSSSSNTKSSSFTLERLLAIHSSIVNSFYTDLKEKENKKSTQRACKQLFLGSKIFWNGLQELIEMKMINHIESSEETICFDTLRDKYKCALDEDEAFQIANEIDFPLINYLM